MKQNQLILVADNNPEKLEKAFGKLLRTMRIISVILIVLGILFAVGGFSMENSLGPYADDSEKLIAVAGIAIGLIAILAGIFCPRVRFIEWKFLFAKKPVLTFKRHGWFLPFCSGEKKWNDGNHISPIENMWFLDYGAVPLFDHYSFRGGFCQPFFFTMRINRCSRFSRKP